jgi:hypothetical protein
VGSRLVPFPQLSFLKSYISPLLPSLVTSTLKMGTACEISSSHGGEHDVQNCLQFWTWAQHVSLKRCHRPTKPHGAKTQDSPTDYTDRRDNLISHWLFVKSWVILLRLFSSKTTVKSNGKINMYVRLEWIFFWSRSKDYKWPISA